MRSHHDELPNLNYIWVGPPKLDSSGNPVLGSDVKSVIDMAEKCQNPICYYCLDEHVDHYKELFQEQNVNVTVVSIDVYLNEMGNHSNKRIREYADKMLEIRAELLKNPRDRIIDRVSFKDAFSLFLLASQGGYTLDTNVKVDESKTDISFKDYEHFMYPYGGLINGSEQPTPHTIECWMMYAPPNNLHVPVEILGRYLSGWDEIQNIIRGNERMFDRVMNFHDEITSLMINSITTIVVSICADNPPDPNWRYQWPKEHSGEEYTGVGAFIVKLPNLGIVKAFGSSHKPQYECRQLILDEVIEYVEQKSVNEARKIFLDSLKNKIKDYDNNNVTLVDLTILNKRFKQILEIAKEIDMYAIKISEISSNYESGSNDIKKKYFAQQIDEAINRAYDSLNIRLQETDSPLYKIREVFETLQSEVKAIRLEAAIYHNDKHPVARFFTKSRLGEMETPPNTATPKPEKN